MVRKASIGMLVAFVVSLNVVTTYLQANQVKSYFATQAVQTAHFHVVR